MRKKTRTMLLLLCIIATTAFIGGCEKEVVKKTYVVTYKVKFSGQLTEDVKIVCNDNTEYVNPSTTSEWSKSTQYQSGQSVSLSAAVYDDDCGGISVTATILVNGNVFLTETETGECVQQAFVIGRLPSDD